MRPFGAERRGATRARGGAPQRGRNLIGRGGGLIPKKGYVPFIPVLGTLAPGGEGMGIPPRGEERALFHHGTAENEGLQALPHLVVAFPPVPCGGKNHSARGVVRTRSARAATGTIVGGVLGR